MNAPELLPDPQPATITVTGDGLTAYAVRAKSGELHIYKMTLPPNRNGVYVLHLLWLNGRTLYNAGQTPPPEIQPPLQAKAREMATAQAMELFK